MQAIMNTRHLRNQRVMGSVAVREKKKLKKNISFIVTSKLKIYASFMNLSYRYIEPSS